MINQWTICIMKIVRRMSCVCIQIVSYRKRQAKMQKELEDAARDTRQTSPGRLSMKEGMMGIAATVPTKVVLKFVSDFLLFECLYKKSLQFECNITRLYQQRMKQ